MIATDQCGNVPVGERSMSNTKRGMFDAALIANQQENVSTEYKASATLDFSDKKLLDKKGANSRTLGDKHRQEFILDVAAMANGEGGKIFIGIAANKDGFPTGIDAGIDATKINADSLEQILLSNIHPPLEGLSILTIELSSKTSGFIVDVGKATRNAPHQTPDNRYHKRHERTRLVMSDGEIRDAMKRSIDYGRQFGAAWDLGVEVNRISVALKEREALDGGYYVPRERLMLSVSNGLRSAGSAMILLPKVIRDQAAALVSSVDGFNSIVETVDPGQQDRARLNDALRAKVTSMRRQAETILRAVNVIIDKEP